MIPWHFPREGTASFPLTDIQRAYLVGREEGYELGGVSTHAYFEFEGELDEDRFLAALEAVVARHDMLRVVIDPGSGTQRILAAPGPVPVQRLDLRGAPDGERAAALAGVRERMAHAVRPPDRWPLFGVALSRLTDTASRIHIDFDGLAFDLAGWRLVLEDLAAHHRDPGAVPDPPGLGYRDYRLAAAAEPDPSLPAARAHWADADPPPAPRLPLAADPADTGVPVFTARDHLLPARDWAGLRSLASSHGIMAAGLCAGLVAEVLARRSGSTRFTLNIPCSRRARVHPDVDRIVGQFSGFVPVAVDWSAPTFAERARALQVRVWRDVQHQAAAGPALARRLAERYGGGGRALFPVVFTSGLGTPFPAEPFPGCRRVHAASQTPQVYFDAQVLQEGDDLLVTWDTVDAVLGAAAADAMFAEHTALMQRLLDPDEWTRPAPVPGGALNVRTHRVLPRDPLEEVLLRLWEEACGLRGLGVVDDLSSLGTGPAVPLAVADRVEDWLPGAALDRGDLLTAATVADLARRAAAAHPPGWLEQVAALSLEAAALAPATLETATGGER